MKKFKIYSVIGILGYFKVFRDEVRNFYDDFFKYKVMKIWFRGKRNEVSYKVIFLLKVLGFYIV